MPVEPVKQGRYGYTSREIVQETPTAGHVLEQEMGRRYQQGHRASVEGAATVNDEYQQAILQDNPIKRMHTKEIFSALPKENADNTTATIVDNVLSNGEEEDEETSTPLGSNRRTPDLDRIAKFFRSNGITTPTKRRRKQVTSGAKLSHGNTNASPSTKFATYSGNLSSSENIAAKLNFSSDEDTPLSKRQSPGPGTTKLTSSSLLNRLKFDNLTQELPAFFGEAEGGVELNTYKDDDNGDGENRLIYNEHHNQAIYSNEAIHNTMPDTHSQSSQETSAPGLDADSNLQYVDDSTEASVSMKWILRPSNQDDFSSTKPTQIIKNIETQSQNLPIYLTPRAHITSETSDQSESLNQSPKLICSSSNNEVNTQLFGSKSNSNTTLGVVKQALSQKSNKENSLITQQSEFLRGTMEVPETSSPSKTKSSNDLKPVENSSPTPTNKRYDNSELGTIADSSQEKVQLRMSTKAGTGSNHQENGCSVMQSENDLVVVSEAEYTQELPEIEEEVNAETNSTTEIHSSFNNDSQKIMVRRRHSRAKSEEVKRLFSPDFQAQTSSPKKKLKRAAELALSSNVLKQEHEKADPQQDGEELLSRLPTEILTADDEYLSRKDIMFENAIWCQYDLNYKFYPGYLIPSESTENESMVVFEVDKQLAKSSDIYYLDIRVGDAVNYNQYKYQVVALECKNKEKNVIRCIRGYDTVHLRKITGSGALGKRTLVRSLASITLDVNEWTTRPKIILEEGNHTKAMAFRDLRTPIRSRGRALSVSPASMQKVKPTLNSFETGLASEQEAGNEKLKVLTQASIYPHYQFLGGNIFKDCLFVITSLDEYSEELRNIIRSEGGKVVDKGFSDMFIEHTTTEMAHSEKSGNDGRKEPLRLVWKRESSTFKTYRFACLVTDRHLRSLKYLEAMCLGWPIVHWKFITECLRQRHLVVDRIYQFLLPSGESYRLVADGDSAQCTVKSYNIFQFYTNLLVGKDLEYQVAHLEKKMDEFAVIVYGHCDLDNFVTFVFQCFGVGAIYHKNTLESWEDILTESKEMGLRVLVYLNDISATLQSLDLLKAELQTIYGSSVASISVEHKEWLIQSIINEDIGLL